MNKVFLLTTITFISCANPVAPTGGPKDKEPPIIIQIIKDTINHSLQIKFNENIKFKDEIVLNPSKLGSPKPKITVNRRAIVIPNKIHTTHIQLNGSISDVNENNTGSYSDIILNGDSSNKKITIIKPPFYKKSLLISNSYRDSFVYNHQITQDTVTICCLQSITTATIFLDQNKNERINANEWYCSDSINPSFLYPPIKPTLYMDTTHDKHLKIVGEYRYLKTQHPSIDTITIRKEDVPFISDLTEKYKILYQTIDSPIYNKVYTFQDSLVLSGITITNTTFKTLSLTDTIPVGFLNIQNTTTQKINIEIYRNERPIAFLQSDSLQTSSIYLKPGKYYILSYMDYNHNQRFDPTDVVLQYFKEISIIKDIENQIQVNNNPKTDEKTSKQRVKDQPMDTRKILIK